MWHPEGEKSWGPSAWIWHGTELWCLVVVGVASSVDLEAWGVFKWGPRRYRYRGRRLRTGQLEVLTWSPYAARKRVGSRAQLWPRLAAACRLWDGHHRPPASALALLARALAVGLYGGVYEIFRQNTRCARGALITLRRLSRESWRGSLRGSLVWIFYVLSREGIRMYIIFSGNHGILFHINRLLIQYHE